MTDVSFVVQHGLRFLRGNACVDQKLSYGLDGTAIGLSFWVGLMKYSPLAIQEYPHPATATLGDGCTEGGKELDDVSPGDVSRNRVRKNIRQRLSVLVVHYRRYQKTISRLSIPSLRLKRVNKCELFQRYKASFIGCNASFKVLRLKFTLASAKIRRKSPIFAEVGTKYNCLSTLSTENVRSICLLKS
jgi:hypothetical protein